MITQLSAFLARPPSPGKHAGYPVLSHRQHILLIRISAQTMRKSAQIHLRIPRLRAA